LPGKRRNKTKRKNICADVSENVFERLMSDKRDIKVIKKKDLPDERSMLYSAWERAVSVAAELGRLLHIKTCDKCGKRV
jgi:hypothetical protein